MIFVIKMRADAERIISRTIRDKSYQNYVGIALSTKVTMVDMNEPTDRMNGKEGNSQDRWNRLLHHISAPRTTEGNRKKGGIRW